MSHSVRHRALDANTMATLPVHGVKLIEASAGTGKTYTISNLYLRLILQGYSVSNVLVVTFTNAATEELRGRIRSRLYRALQHLEDPDAPADADMQTHLQTLSRGKTPDRLLDTLKLAVRSMDEAAIYTIHGFCQRVLSNYSLRSKQSFELELITDDSVLWKEALKDWWRRNVYPLSSSSANLLLEATGDFDTFCKSQSVLRQTSDKIILPGDPREISSILDDWKEVEPSCRQLIPIWKQRREEIHSILLHSEALARRQENWYHATRLPGALHRLDEYFDSDSLLELPEEFNALCSAYVVRHTKPKKRGTDPDLEDPFFHQCQQLLSRKTQLINELGCSALQQATAWAIQSMEQAKQQNRMITYQDQLFRLQEQLDGDQGNKLARALRKDFPVALVDEFQDTDPIQYAIFRSLYFQKPDTGLYLIGDPKQSIYSFRGSDIFTYMKARSDAGNNRYTLDTNWRSTAGLIQAVNAVFNGHKAPFIYDEAIEFVPVNAALDDTPEPRTVELLEHGRPACPFTIWNFPLQHNGKPLTRKDASARAAIATANEIARLLNGSKQGTIKLGERPLEPVDICILVRKHAEAAEVREALRAVGIAAVSVGKNSIYDSEESRDLLILLQAIYDYPDRRKARAALASNLLGLDYPGLDSAIRSETRWLQWSDGLQDLHVTWRNQGFMTMFQSMLHRFDIGQSIACSTNAERRLTNLLHLAEDIQQASKLHSGPSELITWLKTQIEENTSNEAELRLETDAALVSIATIHASKGLEYPLVFIPYLWNYTPVDTKAESIVFHDTQHRGYLDLGSSRFAENLILADKERLAEDIRLAYVALTRAKAKVYLAWGQVLNNGYILKSGVGYLLHRQYTAVQPDTGLPGGDLSRDQLVADLERLRINSGGSIEYSDLADKNTPSAAIGTDSTTELSPGIFRGEVATDWRIASFTSLTRDVHQTPHGGSPHTQNDDILDFPAGSRTGLFLHALLERLPFDDDCPEQQTIELTHQLAPRFGIDPDTHQQTLVRWITNILNTPLDDQQLRLNRLGSTRRLNELEFDLSTRPVKVAALNRLLKKQTTLNPEPIRITKFQGLVTGIIDLVFEYQGRIFIADYKSNFLGGALADYARPQLQQAIYDRRYDVQYLLYVLAVHRYLGQRLRGYRYDRHFGGVYYLFLRGMRAENRYGSGIYFTRPERTLIDELDQEIFAFAQPAKCS